MGTTPGSESGNYPNFTKDVFAAESNPYYAAFIEDTYHASKKSDHHRLACAGTSLGDGTSALTAKSNFDPNATNTVSGRFLHREPKFTLTAA